jgi:hypothetical protein
MLDCIREDNRIRAAAARHDIQVPSMQWPVGDPQARDAAVLRQVQVGLVEYAAGDEGEGVVCGYYLH